MSKIQLVAVDLDGTLLTSAGMPAAEGARMLRKASERGVRVVLATTRTPLSTRAFALEIGLQDPMICTNGAQVWGSPDGPVWYEKLIPREVGLEMARIADENGWELRITVGEMTYWKQRPGQEPGLAGPRRLIVPTNVEAVVGDPVRILAYQPEAIKALNALCRDRFMGSCRSDIFYARDGSPHSLGIFASGADKESALKLVLDRLGIAPENAVAIGDNLNDLPMFKLAGCSAAMGNAVDQVKRQASVVAPDHDQEGVAWVIQNYVLGNEDRKGDRARG